MPNLELEAEVVHLIWGIMVQTRMNSCFEIRKLELIALLHYILLQEDLLTSKMILSKNYFRICKVRRLSILPTRWEDHT
jgi:hypothetical protein